MDSSKPARQFDGTRRSAFRRIAALSVVPGVAAALAMTGGISAQAAPAAPDKAPAVRTTDLSSKPATVSHPNTLTPAVKRLMKGTGIAAEQQAVSAYWTSARMKAAKPLEQTDTFKQLGSAPKQSPNTKLDKPQGPAKVVAPSKAATAPRAIKTAPRVSADYWYPNLPYYYPAARTNGKVFFSRNGGNYVCSASIVNSEGKSLVWTAGHCIVDGRIWDSNFAFVPSYSNGARPYGTWYSRQLTTTAGWYYNRDFTQDVGAVTVNRNFGYRIADYLGSQGIMWNQTPNYYANAFGYPAGYPFNGQYLVRADGYTGNPGNGTLYMYSGMTGGSSGGPWFRNFDGNWGYVNGHNDFIYTSSPNYMYTPYYGNQVAQLYNAVRYQTS